MTPTRALWVGLLAAAGTLPALAASERHGSVVTEYLSSDALKANTVGVDARRSVSVYLPPGYGEGQKAYPVVYYLTGLFWSNEKLFADPRTQKLLDRAMSEGVTKEFILVAANYSTANGGSFYENSPVTGNWQGFIVDELVPFVDKRFRTLPSRESRGITGEVMGGYGALKMAMLHPEVFSVVYALHPSATGTGWVPMSSVVDWAKVHRAKSFKDLEGDGFAQVFTAMSQAFLPNPGRPPFSCDFMVEMENGAPKLNVAHAQKLQDGFLLDHMLVRYADNLRKLRAIKFDWGRYDSNQDHVYANQAFTRKLDELGIEHFAEEYRGNAWEKNWTDDGRVHDELLPFFSRYLVFE
jgi:hypothetical protein